MHTRLPRRQFLQSSAALGLGAGLGLNASAITPARGAMIVKPETVRLRPEIEPVVKWMEETPREKILDAAIVQLKAGLSYRDLMAGLFLAGIRNIKPRPVGFKFHAVMVIHSAHLLGQTAAVDERLIPMLWALDEFKRSQEADVKEGDWSLGPVDESRLPSPSQAKSALIKAMDDWDADAADAATSALCRSAGAAETMEPFWRYGVRDHRNIGHKAIFAAQSWRTLQTIGWPHAEPVLRSLSFGILDRQGDPGRGSSGPYEANLDVAKNLRQGWSAGNADPGATQSLLDTLRHAKPEAASAETAALLNRGVAPESLWDAVTLAGSELLLKKPGIIALHAMTSANALHFIYGASGDDTTRKLALLQAAGWIAMFRDALGSVPELSLDAMAPAPSEATGPEALNDIFATVSRSRRDAAAKALGYVSRGGSAEDIFAVGRRMIFHKGRDSHDFKYAAAAWEEAVLASDPKWRGPLTAAALAHFPGTNAPDSPLMTRAREAVASVLGADKKSG
ncbi:MAG: hypothetical protein JWN86_2115 [Planctomycetota bacterium]|nr:hypothetical protein [Planctomycetota bacterium]